jgi:ABC-type transport system involved in cytochrome bd biosynthesis fused ATPase/permease subunit
MGFVLPTQFVYASRLRGLETLRLFNRTSEQTQHIESTTEDFRETTMTVLKMAFLSSAVLEFFTSISIALMAVYFGFSYLGQVEFGTYGTTLTLFTGFFCLILAPEFYQPLRDLGTYYHDRAAGIGAADAIVDFLEADYLIAHQGNEQIPAQSAVEIQAEKMIEVLNQVGLGKLLEQEQGLDIWLGDGGRPLSGGEQRRLGLARILLNDAPILLLDEPTEGLDRETERQILRLILAHAENKTLIMVTHRLTAIEQFDELCVIDEAKLIEKGTYTELLQLEKGFFKQLVERV